MLSAYALWEIIVCWVVWVLAFIKPRRQAAGQKKVVAAPSSKRGIVLQTVAFALTCAFARPAAYEKSIPSLIAAMILGPASVVVGWAAARHLGKQWRFEAALNEDHELVQTGPYRWVRASHLRIDAGDGACYGLRLDLVAVANRGARLFPRRDRDSGSGRRSSAERRFQESFAAYRARVPAYIPFIR